MTPAKLAGELRGDDAMTAHMTSDNTASREAIGALVVFTSAMFMSTNRTVRYFQSTVTRVEELD
jgi:hypothetical protein